MNCHLNDDNGALLSASRFVQLRQLHLPVHTYADVGVCVISSSIVLCLHKLTNSGCDLVFCCFSANGSVSFVWDRALSMKYQHLASAIMRAIKNYIFVFFFLSKRFWNCFFRIRHFHSALKIIIIIFLPLYLGIARFLFHSSPSIGTWIWSMLSVLIIKVNQ